MNTEPLLQILQTWIRRWRLQRAVLWAARGLAFGLGFALLFGAAALLQARIVQSEFFLLVALSAAFFPLLFGLTAYFWRIQPLEAARYFDIEFRLAERMSAALEFGGAGELGAKQLEDALRFARKVKPARAIPLRIRKKDAELALLLALSLAAFSFWGESLFAAAARQRQVESLVAEQRRRVEEIIREIETNDALSPEQKEALAEPLRQAQRDLQETRSLEGAVSILTDAGEEVQRQGAALQDEEAMQALKEAGGSLAAQEDSPLAAVGRDLASGNFAQAAADLLNMDLSKMTQQELNQLADQLDEMAAQIQSSNPQMAQALREAARQIRAGNLQAAREALNQAAAQMNQAAQQAAALQAAEQAAGQLRAGAGQALAAGGGQNAASLGGSGSGDAPDGARQGGEADSAPIPQNNGAGDGGESASEQIYAPLLNGAGEDSLPLPASGSEGEVVGEGPASASEGESLIPYSEVYQRYEEVYRQAIENGEVPPQFLDVVRNYFSSIQP